LGRICVFCGSRDGARPEYVAAARSLGAALARRGIGLVYGGATVGLMGAVADAVMRAGGEVDGVIPGVLVEREIAPGTLSRLHHVGTMHERKALMARLSDGFVALPGGTGTLDELFEIITWAQLGIHDRPIGLLEVAGYWEPLLAFLRHAVDEGFIQRGDVARDPDGSGARLIVDSDPEALLDRLARAQAVAASTRPRADLGLDKA
jgi:uncharacterized protein (TIGR00730 family)